MIMLKCAAGMLAWWRSCRAYALLAVCFGGGWVSAPAWGGTIASDGVVLEYATDPSAGLVLVSLGKPGEPGIFSLLPIDLWETHWRDADGVKTVVRPSDASFVFMLIESSAEAFVARWMDVTTPDLPGVSFDVILNATAPPNDQVVLFTIQVSTQAPSHALYKVLGPRIEVASHGPAESQVLAYPFDGGWLYYDPIDQLPATPPAEPHTHPGVLSMQWLAYYNSVEDEPAVLFAGTRDTAGCRKEFSLSSGHDPDVLRFTVGHVPENNLVPDGDYASPYPVVLGVVQGDWYDAARFYRHWALRQPWAADGPIRSNLGFSSIVKQADMCGTIGLVDEGHPEYYQYWPRDLAFQLAYFDVDHIPTLAYHWHYSLFDDYWGDWFPIDAEFIPAAAEVLAAGQAFAPYLFTQAYDPEAQGYDNSYVPGYEGHSVEEYGIVDENGDYVFGGHADALFLCEACGFVDAYTLYLAQELADQTGAQGVYLDIYNFAEPRCCYAPAHGHPLGGGDYITQARVNYARNLRETMREQGGPLEVFFTYTESQSEFSIGVIELAHPHNSGDTTGEPGAPNLALAPLFMTVYHDYQVIGRVFPLHTQELLSDEQYDGARQAYSAHLFFGHMPWAGSQLGPVSIEEALDASPHYALLMQMIQNYMAVLKLDAVKRYTMMGERLRDPVTDAALVPPLPMGWFRPYALEQPVVYATAYRDPEQPGFGLLLLNWTDDQDDLAPAQGGTQTVHYSLRPSDLALPGGRYLMSEYHSDGTVQEQIVNEPDVYAGTVVIPERSAVFRRFLLLGDMNCDGSLNAFDIDSFILALSDPEGFKTNHPSCDLDHADCNANGIVDAFDVDSFLSLLTARD